MHLDKFIKISETLIKIKNAKIIVLYLEILIMMILNALSAKTKQS